MSITEIALREFRERLAAEGYVIVPLEPTEAMKRAAFGPVMMGGRGGPITADFARQEAALCVYRKMIEAAVKRETDSGRAAKA